MGTVKIISHNPFLWWERKQRFNVMIIQPSPGRCPCPACYVNQWMLKLISKMNSLMIRVINHSKPTASKSRLGVRGRTHPRSKRLLVPLQPTSKATRQQRNTKAPQTSTNHYTCSIQHPTRNRTDRRKYTALYSCIHVVSRWSKIALLTRVIWNHQRVNSVPAQIRTMRRSWASSTYELSRAGMWRSQRGRETRTWLRLGQGSLHLTNIKIRALSERQCAKCVREVTVK